MSTKEPKRGVLAPILTPFDDDMNVAHDLFTEHAQKMIEAGCVGLAPFGTTGEGPSITEKERTNALWHLTQAGIAAEKLLPGTGMTTFEGTAALSRACMDMGCHGVLVLPPFYYKAVTEDGLFAWFARVIEAVGDDLRMYLYNIPHVANVTLTIPLVQRLRKAFPEQVVGIKDSSGDLENAKTLLAIDGLEVYLGSENLLAQIPDMGATGSITATANLNAGPVSEFVAALLSGDKMGAEYLRESVTVARDIMAARDLIPTPKRVLALRTGDARWLNVRPPFVPASVAAGESLEAELTAAA